MIVKKETKTYFHIKISDNIYNELLNLLYTIPNTDHIIQEFLINEDKDCAKKEMSILETMSKIKEGKIKFESKKNKEDKQDFCETEFSESECLSESLDSQVMYNDECSVYLGKSSKGLNPVIIKTDNDDEEVSIPLNHYNAIAFVNETEDFINETNTVINRQYYYNNEGNSKVVAFNKSIILTKFPNGTMILSKDDKTITLTTEEMIFIRYFIIYHKNLK